MGVLLDLELELFCIQGDDNENKLALLKFYKVIEVHSVALAIIDIAYTFVNIANVVYVIRNLKSRSWHYFMFFLLQMLFLTMMFRAALFGWYFEVEKGIC
jgi:hypothetical protein